MSSGNEDSSWSREDTAAAWNEFEEHRKRENESVLAIPAFIPEGPADLHGIVRRLLREKYGTEPSVDDDGDFVVRHMRQPIWIRVQQERPIIEISARVAHDVHSRRATAVELGILNRDSMWFTWNLHGRSVWLHTAAPGLPFSPTHLDGLLDGFLQAMSVHRDDLAYRVGAQVA